MITKDIDRLLPADLEAVVGVSERRTLEFKEALPMNWNDDAKVEFLADVSSLANASGGYLLYGIPDVRDENGRATGIAGSIVGVTTPNIDTELRRLEAFARDGIAPRIHGLRVGSVGSFTRGPVIAIWVPRSLNAPHMVTYGGRS